MTNLVGGNRIKIYSVAGNTVAWIKIKIKAGVERDVRGVICRFRRRGQQADGARNRI